MVVITTGVAPRGFKLSDIFSCAFLTIAYYRIAYCRAKTHSKGQNILMRPI